MAADLSSKTMKSKVAQNFQMLKELNGEKTENFSSKFRNKTRMPTLAMCI